MQFDAKHMLFDAKHMLFDTKHMLFDAKHMLFPLLIYRGAFRGIIKGLGRDSQGMDSYSSRLSPDFVFLQPIKYIKLWH